MSPRARTALIAGNWKMHTTQATARDLARAVADIAAAPGVADAVDVLVAPPFTALAAVADVARGTPVRVAAQDMHWADTGAFTGEVSPVMVAELATHVILGHSERRHGFGETDGDVNRKAHAALAHGLVPIVCVGETLAERDAGQTDAVVARQVDAALEGAAPDEAGRAVVAYEPVWAIGTGRACDPAEAGRVMRLIRQRVAAAFGAPAADAVRLVYGGSVTPDNAAAYFADPDIDGALVGGASLKADAFGAIIRAAAAAPGAPAPAGARKEQPT